MLLAELPFKFSCSACKIIEDSKKVLKDDSLLSLEEILASLSSLVSCKFTLP